MLLTSIAGLQNDNQTVFISPQILTFQFNVFAFSFGMFDEEKLLVLYTEINQQSRYADPAQCPIARTGTRVLNMKQTTALGTVVMSAAEMLRVQAPMQLC